MSGQVGTLGQTAGRLGYLTPEQEEALAGIKDAMKFTPEEALYWDDPMLLRFLRARQFDLAKTELMLRNTIAWRAEYKPEEIPFEGIVQTELEKGKAQVIGHDKINQPSFIFWMGRHLPEESTPADVMRSVVYVLELLSTRRMPYPVECCSIIFDFRDWGYKNVDRKLVSAILGTMQHYYPERLGRAYIVQSPWIFKSLWSFVANFLDDRVKRKVCFLTANYSEELLMDFDPDQLPTTYGGTMDLDSRPDVVTFFKAMAAEPVLPRGPPAAGETPSTVTEGAGVGEMSPGPELETASIEASSPVRSRWREPDHTPISPPPIEPEDALDISKIPVDERIRSHSTVRMDDEYSYYDDGEYSYYSYYSEDEDVDADNEVFVTAYSDVILEDDAGKLPVRQHHHHPPAEPTPAKAPAPPTTATATPAQKVPARQPVAPVRKPVPKKRTCGCCG